MPVQPVKFHKVARFNYLDLAEADRKRLDEELDRLDRTPPADWPGENVRRLPSPEPLYLLSFTPELRAFVAPAAGGIEVQQITNQGALDSFHAHGKNGNGAAG